MKKINKIIFNRNKHVLYNKLAKYTDLSYFDKDYKRETKFILKRIKENKIIGKTLIDVACGSGNHSKLLQKKGYKIYGVDLNKGMLNLIKRNIPNIKLYEQDMRKLNLPIKSDVIICMFNSINYNMGYDQFEETLRRFYSQLNKKGIVIFDTFFTKENWKEGHFGIKKFSAQNLDVARVFKSTSKGNVGRTNQTYIIYENGKKKLFEDVNEIYLFDKNKLKEIMKKIGFKTKIYYDFSENTKKGHNCVFVGVKNE